MMKRINLIIILIVFLTIGGYSKVRFFADFTGNYLRPADTGYADIYGDKVFYPEVIAGLKFYRGIYLFTSYGKLNLKGNITDAGEGVNATSKQSFLAAGIGYEFMSDSKISLKISGGIVFVKYHERVYMSDVLLDEDEGKKNGYKFEIGVYYNFMKPINIGVTVGYFHAQNTEDYYRKLSYGGLKLGLSIGLKL
jgi:opacity protein-like surface antigen